VKNHPKKRRSSRPKGKVNVNDNVRPARSGTQTGLTASVQGDEIPVKYPDFEARSKKIFGDRVLNAVEDFLRDRDRDW
jgi:hypothetical protein